MSALKLSSHSDSTPTSTTEVLGTLFEGAERVLCTRAGYPLSCGSAAKMRRSTARVIA